MHMCSKEEVVKVISESEQRILGVLHNEINKLRDEVRADREASHMVLSKSISNFGAEVIKASQDLRDFMLTKGAEIDKLTIWKAVHSSEADVIKENIQSIQTILSRLMWLVISGVLIALLGLVLK